MKGEGAQQLNLNNPKCVKKGIVIHEVLHAAGFFHQQSSADRDEFVEIKWENIKPDPNHDHRKLLSGKAFICRQSFSKL